MGILFFLTSVIYAQEGDSTYKYWMTIGGMINRDVSMNLNYNFSLGSNFYKVGYLVNGGFSQNPSIGEDEYLYNSIDFSIGKRFQSEWFQVSAFSENENIIICYAAYRVGEKIFFSINSKSGF